MRTKILQSQVIEQICCPYCYNELSGENAACCGEAGHGEKMFALDDDSSWMTQDEFDKVYEIERDCGCEKTCFCEPESTQDR